MQEGSSPLIANWMPSTSMVVYTTRLPDSSVQLSCSISSTFCAELLATWNSESNFKDVNEVFTLAGYGNLINKLVKGNFKGNAYVYAKKRNAIARMRAIGNVSHFVQGIPIGKNIKLLNLHTFTISCYHIIICAFIYPNIPVTCFIA